ncbi:DUF6352 family protein [Azospirillum rugosum]|uniref:Uncharacterized protein n=1 Tax=Azospirillum rugosum TaxID=416170 RepID=A0ABS4SNA8_9PROT|nr:DUF6352 family protein [Azospirillum rugosum]MBP2294047.1 hypothetical protein [Azospirillum rugosum]MDQ0527564.1 hypothetical protein [Azospirillum rugosum]
MPDFWRESGYHLLDRDADGRLAVTPDFLRAYLMRPEMRPPEDACDTENALYAGLLDDPTRSVPPGMVEALADEDARENWAVWLGFRDRLLAAGTVEGCYLRLFREGARGVPGLFVDQLAHVILRGILDETPSGLRARAGELFFRQQAVSVEDGRVRLADAETVEMLAATGGFGSLGRLVVEAGTAPRSVEMDILDETNHGQYWGRESAHDTVLDVTFAAAGLDALSRVLEAWVAHFLGVKVTIHPVQRISDERWVWHVGLDAEATAILNDLYNGVEVTEERLARVLSLFRLEFADPAAMRADLAGRPVYLAMAMGTDRKLRLKPQNLLVNLPLAERS